MEYFQRVLLEEPFDTLCRHQLTLVRHLSLYKHKQIYAARNIVPCIMCADHCEFTTSFWDVIWPKAEGQNFDKHRQSCVSLMTQGIRTLEWCPEFVSLNPLTPFFFKTFSDMSQCLYKHKPSCAAWIAERLNRPSVYAKHHKFKPFMTLLKTSLGQRLKAETLAKLRKSV